MEDLLQETLTAEVYGNGVLLWGVAIAGAAGIYIGLLALRRVLIGRFARYSAAEANTLSHIIGTVAHATQHFLIAALALGPIAYALILPPQIEGILSAIITIAVMLQIGLWSTALLGLWITQSFLRRAAHDPEGASAAQLIRLFCLIGIWSAILLLTLSNFGIDITGLVAGLGIGGIAVAFALQSILKDLFASLAIILDKPFVVGDFIIFGEQLGSVERIGLKTTRVRSLWGEQISVSNDDLLSSRVRNYKRMSERRVSFDVRVVYETPMEKLEGIPHRIREIIESLEGTRFDRSHVAAFEDYGHRIETVYYVLSPDYNAYMDIQQRINLGIVRHFTETGIAFAYPVRRLLPDGNVSPMVSPSGKPARSKAATTR
ncbi:MAG: mechanosensitive ion channel family protein [Dongiaceae bacterium]